MSKLWWLVAVSTLTAVSGGSIAAFISGPMSFLWPCGYKITPKFRLHETPLNVVGRVVRGPLVGGKLVGMKMVNQEDVDRFAAKAWEAMGGVALKPPTRLAKALRKPTAA